MRAAARVLDVRAEHARLACDQQPACPTCRGGRGCALRWLAPAGSPVVEVPRLTPQGVPLIAGQSVTIEVADGELLKSAARVYLLPLCGLLAGPALVRWSLDGGEAAALLAAAIGVVLGWALARHWIRLSPPRFAVHLEPAADGS